jgi:hypothetical protein
MVQPVHAGVVFTAGSPLTLAPHPIVEAVSAAVSLGGAVGMRIRDR